MSNRKTKAKRKRKRYVRESVTKIERTNKKRGLLPGTKSRHNDVVTDFGWGCKKGAIDRRVASG
jgi:hypothetical protein